MRRDRLSLGLRLLILVVLPIANCMLMCMIQHMRMQDFYLPTSGWNDELIYYKQVEAYLANGVNRGYFGYNESSALRMTFGAWSPIVLIPWLCFGKLFGWSYLSPVICNLLLMCVAMLMLGIQCKLDWKQVGWICVLYSVYRPLTRYVLSCTCESIIVAVLIMVVSTSILYQKQGGIGRGIAAGIGALFLTTIRPYYVLLYVLLYRRTGKKGKWELLAIILGMLVSVAGYFYITKYYCAAFLTPLIDVQWIREIIDNPASGMKSFGIGVWTDVQTVCRMGMQSFKYANLESAYYLFALLVVVILAVTYYRNKTEKLIGQWALYVVIMLGAVVILYDINAGARHLMGVTFVGLLLPTLKARRYHLCDIIIAILLIWVYLIRTYDDYSYTIPRVDATIEAEMERAGAALEETMSAREEGWESTCIWVLEDSTTLEFGKLYALPAGIGINACTKWYTMQNLKEMKAMYLATNAGEEIDQMLRDMGREEIITYGGIRIWKIQE